MVTLWASLTNAVRPTSMLYLPKSERPAVAIEQLLADAERTAGHIDRTCLRTNQPPRIGLLMANGEPWLRGLLATFRMGATAVPLPLPVLATGVHSYLEQLSRLGIAARLDVILVDESMRRFVSRIQELLSNVPLLDITVVPDASPPGAEANDQDLAVIQYTSGSTASPKGVALTHANILAGTGTIIENTSWNHEETVGVWLPLFHDMGLMTVLMSILAGGSVCLWRPSDFIRDPMRWLAGFASSPATGSTAPNFAYSFMAKAAEFGAPDNLDLSKWRVACNGAEPVQYSSIEAFDRAFRPYGWRPEVMSPCYGLAEATLMVTSQGYHSAPSHLTVDRFGVQVGRTVSRVTENAAEARQLVSVGRAAPGVQVRVGVDDVPAGERVVGEIQVSGPSVMRGYLETAGDGQPFTADGWLKTGDIGFFDAGELYVVGRIKDTFVVRGQNYYAEDIEELAKRSAGGNGLRAAAIPVDEGDAESILVVIETTLEGEESVALAKTIEADVATQLALDKISVRPVAPHCIPVTTSGKVKRHAVRRQYEQQPAEQARFATKTTGGRRS